MSDEETQRYTGGCHCGAVKYDVELASHEAMACNCSICSKMGWLMAFVPEGAFTLKTDASALTNYQFGKQHIHHQFCNTCGIRSFAWGPTEDGSKLYCINVRCLDDIDLDTLKIQNYDGASI